VKYQSATHCVHAVLEAYTLQLDYLLFQLEELGDDIDEFWVATQQEIGRKRNTLFVLQIIVNTVTMAFSFVAMVGAIFGTPAQCCAGNCVLSIRSTEMFPLAEIFRGQRAAAAIRREIAG
jgi:hypothetical protein